jgi:hypothetical protein
MRIGSAEDGERRFILSRDRSGIYLIDLITLTHIKIAGLESEEAHYDSDYKSRKILMYMS